MDDPSECRIIRRASRLAYTDPENPHVSVYYDDVEWPDGRPGRYNRIVEGEGHPGVGVLPIHAEGIGLVRVDRYPVGRRLWEIPRGFGECPDAAEDARRELAEETGWQARELIRLGAVFSNSGLLSGQVELFAAMVGDATPEPDGLEITDVAIFSEADIRIGLVEGRLPDAITQSALLLASMRKLIRL
jgi:ADP-ribose pyrophosphatase